MNHPVFVFRAFLVASIAAGLLGGLLDLALPSLIPQLLREAQDALTSPELTRRDILLLIVGLPLLLGAVACAVGLYRFRPWAPRASIYLTIGSLVIYPLLDVTVVSQWSLLLTESGAILWGAMLAMAFLSPVKEHFNGVPANFSSSGRA